MDSDDNANDYDEKLEDWYHSSDTSDDIPDPNMSADPLFQDQDLLPEPLQRDHFKEGLIYTMTKHIDRKNALLVLIIEAKLRTFSYQCFFQQRSSSSTYHKTGKETKCAYKDIWRLELRNAILMMLRLVRCFVLNMECQAPQLQSLLYVEDHEKLKVKSFVEPIEGKKFYTARLKCFIVRRFLDHLCSMICFHR